MDKFSVILPNEKQGSYKVITVLISFMNIIGFSYLGYRLPDTEDLHFIAILGALTSLPPVIRLFLIKEGTVFSSRFLRFFYNDPQENLLRTVILGFILSSLVWVLLGYYMIATLVFVFAIAGLIAVRRLEVIITNGYISYPSIPVKKIQWQEVSTLIIKDGIFTLDLNNNKLYQFTLNESENENLNETDFNVFVHQKMASKN